jgi:hypothetical protein
MWDDAAGHPNYISESEWVDLYLKRTLRRGGENVDL